MSYYIAQLNAGLKAAQDRQAREAEAAQAAEVATARERLTPLDDRLGRLLTSIPLSVQREGLSLPTMQAMLKGRHRGTCHPGELGKALRRLGWTRRRCWRGDDDGGFAARWHPPETV